MATVGIANAIFEATLTLSAFLLRKILAVVCLFFDLFVDRLVNCFEDGPGLTPFLFCVVSMLKWLPAHHVAHIVLPFEVCLSAFDSVVFGRSSIGGANAIRTWLTFLNQS